MPLGIAEGLRLSFFTEFVLHAELAVEDTLADTEILGGDFQQFIICKELHALLQTHLSGRDQTQRIVGTGSAHISQLLALQTLTMMTSALGVMPTTMPS